MQSVSLKFSQFLVVLQHCWALEGFSIATGRSEPRAPGTLPIGSETFFPIEGSALTQWYADNNILGWPSQGTSGSSRGQRSSLSLLSQQTHLNNSLQITVGKHHSLAITVCYKTTQANVTLKRLGWPSVLKKPIMTQLVIWRSDSAAFLQLMVSIRLGNKHCSMTDVWRKPLGPLEQGRDV